MIRCSIVAGALILFPAAVQAQANTRNESATLLHVTASSSLVILRTVIDGVTESTWDFGAARLHRAAVDVTVGDGTSVGLAFGIASLPTSFARVVPQFTSPNCQTRCDVTADLWSAAVTLHVGDKPGFHQVIDGSAGILSVGNFHQKSSDEKLGPQSRDKDFAFSFGWGLGYSANRHLQITLVQDVGFSLHNRSGSLASPSNALNPLLMTRLGIRAGFGR